MLGITLTLFDSYNHSVKQIPMDLFCGFGSVDRKFNKACPKLPKLVSGLARTQESSLTPEPML